MVKISSSCGNIWESRIEILASLLAAWVVKIAHITREIDIMSFKKLTHYNGSVVYINFNKVTTISVDKDGRTVIFYSGEEYVKVKESPQTIFHIVPEGTW